jgi:hypothetical protein
VIQNLYDEYHNQDINVIIGSSMGGFTAYHLANSLGICALFTILPTNDIRQIACKPSYKKVLSCDLFGWLRMMSSKQRQLKLLGAKW